MPRARIEVEEQRDFTGGLNLSDDPYNLGKTESFDLQNVDVDRRGGFGVRRGSRRFIATPVQRTVTATGASRTGNVVTATGLSPANGDPGGLVPGQTIRVVFVDSSYDGTFTVSTAVAAATTATWAQTAADDPSAGTGVIVEGFSGGGNPDSGYTFVDTSLNRHILVARGGHVKRWDGAAWQDVHLADTSGRTRFTEMENILYILPPNGSVPYTWTGSGLAVALTAAHTSYNDNLAAPVGGVGPNCISMAAHHSVMFAGGVLESTGFENSRLRWSHPGTAEDWRTNDFIDIDKDDENGRIRALVPFGDRLIVFKDRAIYAVHGYPPAGFSVQNLTKEIGAPSQWAVVATEETIYFWDVDTGAWSYDGKEFKHIFQPLFPLIDDNKINNAFSFQVFIEFHNERVWLSVPFLAPPYQNLFVSLVFDPNASKNGAWMVHTKTSFGWWRHRGSDGGDVHLIGGDSVSGAYLMEFDVENLFQDEATVLSGLEMDGVAGNYASTPDSAQHDITSDLEVEISARADNWTDATSRVLASKWALVAGGRSWMLRLMSGGFLRLAWSTDGSNLISTDSTVPMPLNGDVDIRARLDVNDGAGGHVVTYEYRQRGTTLWIQLGDPTNAGPVTTSVFNSSAPIEMGSAHAGIAGADPWNGYIYSFVLRDGFDGTVLANPDFYTQAILTPSFVDLSGLTWTMQGAARITWRWDFVSIEAWYATRWFDARSSAIKKRWKRPIVIMRGGSTQTTVVDVLSDYDPTRVNKSFNLQTSQSDDEGEWDVSDWDDTLWAAEVTLGGERSEILRGAPLGTGTAKALRFKNLTMGQDWRIHGLTMKWISKRLRN